MDLRPGAENRRESRASAAPDVKYGGKAEPADAAHHIVMEPTGMAPARGVIVVVGLTVEGGTRKSLVIVCAHGRQCTRQ